MLQWHQLLLLLLLLLLLGRRLTLVSAVIPADDYVDVLLIDGRQVYGLHAELTLALWYVYRANVM